jgi:chaperone modulatory protein CbpM
MTELTKTYLQGRIVEDEMHLTLLELCRACGVHEAQVTSWVIEGVLEPIGEKTRGWQFGGASLARARIAQRLTRDLDLDTAALALVLDLLQEIDELKAQIRRSGAF